MSNCPNDNNGNEGFPDGYDADDFISDLSKAYGVAGTVGDALQPLGPSFNSASEFLKGFAPAQAVVDLLGDFSPYTANKFVFTAAGTSVGGLIGGAGVGTFLISECGVGRLPVSLDEALLCNSK